MKKNPEEQNLKKQNLNKSNALLQEPLMHFLLIGGVLFFLFTQFGTSSTELEKAITITDADLTQLSAVWLKRTGQPPSEAQREKQLEHYIREQILYREAMAMGLDKNDVIVRRRLAQKMQFIFDDLSAPEKPTDAELSEYLTVHTEQFYTPATISFTQVFLNPQKQAAPLQAEPLQTDPFKTDPFKTRAKKLLEELNRLDDKAQVIDLGDRSMLPNSHTHVRRIGVENTFGKEFSNAVFNLPQGSWQEGVMSAYGWHAVYVHMLTPQRLPSLNDIRSRVESAWREAKQKQANENFYQSLYQQYEINVDDSVVKNASK